MSAEHTKTLVAWVRAKTTPQRTVLKSRICLLAAEGRSNNTIAQELKTSRPTVLQWRARFALRGPAGLASTDFLYENDVAASARPAVPRRHRPLRIAPPRSAAMHWPRLFHPQ
jgi:hypothetical protein